MTIRDKLIALRGESGLSQQEFADKLNVSRQTVSRWEAGKNVPSSNQISNICNVFGLDANALLADGKPDDEREKENDKSAPAEKRRVLPLIAIAAVIALALAGLVITIVYCVKDVVYDTTATVWIVSIPQNTPMIVLSVFLAVFIILLVLLFVYLIRRKK